MSMIEVDSLKYKYPDTDKLVLDDISFTVEKGEFIGLIGRNTSGKSTLCYALSGLVPHFFKGAYGGKVHISDLEVSKNEVSKIVQKVGLIFENPFSQITGSKLSVYEEIAFGLENMGVKRQKMQQRIDESLDTLNITSIKDRSPFNLSGGQMQRVAIASVIAMQPDVLILDEPTSQLDPRGAEDVFKVVENLSRQGMTIIMADHNMEKIAEYADKVLILDEGKQVDFNTTEQVLSREDLLEHGISPPVITRLSQRLNIRNQKTDLYPIRIKDFPYEAMVKNND